MLRALVLACGLSAVFAAVGLRGSAQLVGSLASKDEGTGVRIVEPVAGSTKLAVNAEGLRVLSALTGPVAPVVVIGPFRSGKSFFINQMLEKSCDEGMVVGHSRLTQTKGIWMWRLPIPVQPPDQAPLSMLVFDTEGFESTGKSDAYDDRIFALSAIISSTLVYNLAETIRESDIEKLSFAVELARAFYSRNEQGAYGIHRGRHWRNAAAVDVEPSHMFWLIQRDFLQGKSAQAMLEEALAPVPNPKSDADIAEVNGIRESLGLLAANSTAIGLPQPHIERTRLCEFTDAELAPDYVAKRDELKRLIKLTARPKVLQGKVLDGAGLAQLLTKMVAALNSRDIPSSASILHTFNQQLMYDLIDAHATQLAQIVLPVPLGELQAAHDAAKDRVMKRLRKESFGNVDSEQQEHLEKALRKAWSDVQTSNEVASNRVCEQLESECEEALEQLSRMALPSLGKFEARSKQCAARFAAHCIGPALARQDARLQHAQARERTRFTAAYNDKLYNGLVALSLATIVLARFVLKLLVPEIAGWSAFVFLEVYPKLMLGASSMYNSGWWQRLIGLWEIVVFNPVIDLEAHWLPLLIMGAVIVTAYRWWQRRRKGRRKKQLEARDLDV